MERKDAVDLIRCDIFDVPDIQSWADLGCGTGIFTEALAQLLTKGSGITAIDMDAMALRTVHNEYNGVAILKKQMDFVHESLPLSELDGILMANSLHYVKDKPAFLKKIKGYMKHGHSFLIVEYETDKPNHWVPYPVPFAVLKDLLIKAGYKSVVRLNERPSMYNTGKMYSAVIR